MKFTAPANVSHFEMDNVDYHRDENGHFEIRHPEHVKAALRHGAVPVVAGDVAAPQTAEERDGEIAALEARLAALRGAAPVAPAPVPATDTPAHPADASGDTSGTTEGTVDASGDTSGATEGTVDEAGSIDPETATRDDMVEWLAKNGVTISPASSKDNARKAVEDFLADKGE